VESDNNILVIALVILVPAALLWAIFVARSRAPRRPGGVLGIPQGLRPGDPDEVLEGPRLERILAAGVVATIATAVFIPAYWLPESDRQEKFVERFEEESLERGLLIAQAPVTLPEDADPQVFKENEKAQALGMGCANCHGGVDEEDPESETNLSGGTVEYTDPTTGDVVNYTAPPLQNVFQRWDEEIIRETIERGRPGTPMPTWGVEYGGPMTQQMVDDIMAYLESLPGNQTPPEISEGCSDPAEEDYESCGQEIFEARCAVCHGPEAQGKEGLPVKDDPSTTETDETAVPTWYPGLALWKGDVTHLDRSLHEKTVTEGRRFQFMPPFGEAPPQGIPIPPYPLTESQIEAVVDYERSL
jgi:mono/diheme cytochrome c family protein